MRFDRRLVWRSVERSVSYLAFPQRRARAACCDDACYEQLVVMARAVKFMVCFHLGRMLWLWCIDIVGMDFGVWTPRVLWLWSSRGYGDWGVAVKEKRICVIIIFLVKSGVSPDGVDTS